VPTITLPNLLVRGSSGTAEGGSADSHPPARASQVVFDGPSWDFGKVEVTRNGASVVLTAHEFKTLQFFVENPDRVITRARLLKRVCGYEDRYTTTRTIDNHIMKLQLLPEFHKRRYGEKGRCRRRRENSPREINGCRRSRPISESHRSRSQAIGLGPRHDRRTPVQNMRLYRIFCICGLHALLNLACNALRRPGQWSC
jgi:hypothetical protein